MRLLKPYFDVRIEGFRPFLEKYPEIVGRTEAFVRG